jgi:hypothetical protein
MTAENATEVRITWKPLCSPCILRTTDLTTQVKEPENYP